VWSQDPLGHKKQGYLSASEFPSIRAKKPAANSELRSGHSAWRCHKLQTMAGLGYCSPRRGPARGKTKVRPPSLPWEEQRGSTPQGSAGFGDSTRGQVPEIETLGHRPGEHGERPETGETAVLDCFSLGAH